MLSSLTAHSSLFMPMVEYLADWAAIVYLYVCLSNQPSSPQRARGSLCSFPFQGPDTISAQRSAWGNSPKASPAAGSAKLLLKGQQFGFFAEDRANGSEISPLLSCELLQDICTLLCFAQSSPTQSTKLLKFLLSPTTHKNTGKLISQTPNSS